MDEQLLTDMKEFLKNADKEEHLIFAKHEKKEPRYFFDKDGKRYLDVTDELFED